RAGQPSPASSASATSATGSAIGSSPRQRRIEARAFRVVGRQAKAQQIGVIRERSGQDAAAGKRSEQPPGVPRAHQPEQRARALRRKAVAAQHAIQRGGTPGQRLPGIGDPCPVGIGHRAERQRGGMNRPIAQQVAQRRQDPLRRDHEAQPQPGKPEELA
ncbi:hypothetical protein OY671_011667, partial [Metschnikowia pulcherrima]